MSTVIGSGTQTPPELAGHEGGSPVLTPAADTVEAVASPDSLWSRLLVALEPTVQATAFESWVRPCRLLAVDGAHLRLGAPNEFCREWLAGHHLEALHAAARAVLGGDPRVSIEVDRNRLSTERDRTRLPVREAPIPPAPAPSGMAIAEELASRYTFTEFVSGSSNQLALAACQTIAQLPSRTYNPLFVYGGVGLGKTHLLHAVGNEIAHLHPTLHVLYISAERFTNEMIAAIRRDRMEEFRARYRTIDVLLIDDIQFISSKERTQGEFFHTFNDLYEMRKQIVLCSDAAPKALPEIGDQLRSRFEWGLIADVQPPGFETRVAIVKKKAEADGVHLPDQVAELIARRAKANIREIEGALTRVLAARSLGGRALTFGLAQEVLGALWSDEDRPITVDEVQRKASEFFGLKVSDLRGKSRMRAIAFPRQVAMYVARHLTHASFGELGRAFGGKDHSTVLHAVDRIETLARHDPEFNRTIECLIQSLSLTR